MVIPSANDLFLYTIPLLLDMHNGDTTSLQFPEIRHYYIDESGSGDLFGKHGEVVLGMNGVSNFFILGLVYLPDPKDLENKLISLRREILTDPYLNTIPSIQPSANKTALKFHAKDDVPEVRREVFKILKDGDIHFSAVIKDMRAVLTYVRTRNRSDATYRYHPNELYDYTVRRLFRDRLHKSDAYQVFFANRGSKAGRTQTLRNQLILARDRFLEGIGKNSVSRMEVLSAQSEDYTGLQIADYSLWALQRFYERHEDRYLSSISNKISLIVDADDKQEADYGTYYTRKNPPTLEKIKSRKV